jgi:Xaa-Pro aminopeptidase
MNADFFTYNRNQLVGLIKGGLIVMTGYTSMQKTADTAMYFEQESNFWYLTGIEQPDWQLIIDTARGKSWLVKPDVDMMHEIFDGTLSAAEASRISGIKNIITSKERDVLLRDQARKHSLVYTVDQPEYIKRANFIPNPSLSVNKKYLGTIFNAVQLCNKELTELRAIKQPIEIRAISKAVKLTGQAFESVKSKLSEYNYEYQIEADFSHIFRYSGAEGHAYAPIVASGRNGCTLHYVQNNSKLAKNKFVLLDVGAKVGGYSADITRTYAIGSVPKRYLDIHSAVEQAHHGIINLIRPGLLVEEYSRMVDSRMKHALREVGLLADLSDDETYRKYFPHAISHGLGIDVHDNLGSPRVFKAGMVITVEPGIYIPDESIGVRIEDDILITEKGNKNLSKLLSTAV